MQALPSPDTTMTSKNGLICFTNCLLVQEDGSLTPRDLWIDERSGLILNAQNTFFINKQRPERTVDLGGNILSPGFIDIQINGAYGFDFSIHEDEEAYRQGMEMVAKRIVETGVTSLLPTVVTQEKSQYPKLLKLLKPFSAEASATLLGWHAEGPFIDYNKRGAHAPPFLLDAPEGYQSFEEVYGADNLTRSQEWSEESFGVRMITAAPEVPGVMDAFKTLSEKGIVLSIGHSAATTDFAVSAVSNGARLITHLFNAMPAFHHRDPSIIGLLGASPHIHPLSPRPLVASRCEMASDTPASPAVGSLGEPVKVNKKFERPSYGLIADGVHCHPNSVRFAYAAHPEGCILVTDAMKILNLADGVHEWRDGKRFVKEGEKLYLEGTNTLAGSVITLDKCIRNLSSFTGCSLGESIKCATFNPAKCLGIESRKGTLRTGADADLVVLNAEGKVVSTWVRGREIWTRAPGV